MELYLIRHPRVNIDAGICYGQSDVALADTFLIEVNNVRSYVPRKFDVIITSPLQRCSHVAHYFAATEVMQDADVLELNFGSWELKHWDDISVQAIDAWAENKEHFRIPEGETVHELFQRVMRCIVRIKAMRNVKTVGVFTHAGVIRCWLAHVAQLPLYEALQLPVDYASVSKIIVQDGQMHIEYMNKQGGDMHGL
jgi:alpha-ribazole phosphatase